MWIIASVYLLLLFVWQFFIIIKGFTLNLIIALFSVANKHFLLIRQSILLCTYIIWHLLFKWVNNFYLISFFQLYFFLVPASTLSQLTHYVVLIIFYSLYFNITLSHSRAFLNSLRSRPQCNCNWNSILLWSSCWSLAVTVLISSNKATK